MFFFYRLKESEPVHPEANMMKYCELLPPAGTTVSHSPGLVSGRGSSSPVVVDEELLLSGAGHGGDGGDDVLQHHLGPLLHQLRVGGDEDGWVSTAAAAQTGCSTTSAAFNHSQLVICIAQYVYNKKNALS